MLPPEDPYGRRKRLRFCRQLIAAAQPQMVLDVGCGTGQLTGALAGMFPGVHFTGVDSDAASILHARAGWALPNLEFGCTERLADAQVFDLIIASEVLEHVEQPGNFLAILRDKLTGRGRLLVTLPNGYGPFEIFTLLQTVLAVTGLHALLRRLKHRLAGRPPVTASNAADTLAVSPHINFFSHRAVRRLFADSGLRLVQYQPRTLLCGFLLDQALSHFGLCEWNAAVADRLPAAFSSDWMFVLEKGPSSGQPAYERGWLSRLRRRLNERACGLA
ncbi:MAG TPA: methyltransferase domain-containing protein [Burkholderiales bacterium]|nr:methyltransferase domain-containing protein [Burkholderiales bacterium]